MSTLFLGQENWQRSYILLTACWVHCSTFLRAFFFKYQSNRRFQVCVHRVETQGDSRCYGLLWWQQLQRLGHGFKANRGVAGGRKQPESIKLKKLKIKKSKRDRVYIYINKNDYWYLLHFWVLFFCFFWRQCFVTLLSEDFRFTKNCLPTGIEVGGGPINKLNMEPKKSPNWKGKFSETNLHERLGSSR